MLKMKTKVTSTSTEPVEISSIIIWLTPPPSKSMNNAFEQHLDIGAGIPGSVGEGTGPPSVAVVSLPVGFTVVVSPGAKISRN